MKKTTLSRKAGRIIVNISIVVILICSLFLIGNGIGQFVREYYVKGNYSDIDFDTTKAYSTQYTQVKSNPILDSTGRAWRDGMVGGNGLTGFVESGSPYSDTIIYQNINYILPTTRDRDYLELSYSLDEARQRILSQDDTWRGDDVSWDYNYSFHPGHQLRLEVSDVLFHDYIRWTDYNTGEVATKYTNSKGIWTRKTFTSRVDNVTITSIQKSSINSKVNIDISIDDLSTMWKYGDGNEVDMQYKIIVDDNASYIALSAHYPNYEKSELKDGGYAGVTYVVVENGEKQKMSSKKEKNDENVGEDNPFIRVKNADAVYLITSLDRTFDMGTFEDFKTTTDYELVETLVNNCMNVKNKYMEDGVFSYDKSLEESAQIHKEMFEKVKIHLGSVEDTRKLLSNEDLLASQRHSKKLSEALVERAYNQGRYAMICCSGTTMSRLYGMWTGEWSPAWKGIYTMDANVNLQSSGMNTANLENFSLGYVNFILMQVEDWEYNAKSLFGIEDALMAPVNFDGDRSINAEYCKEYPFQYWNAGASWMLQPIYEYYQCYGNKTLNTMYGEKDLLEDILLPLLTKQSNYWKQLCTAEYYTDANGYAKYENGKTTLNENETYLIIPSYSPENHPTGYESCIAANSTIDISAAKSGLQMTIDIENELKQEGYLTRIESLQYLIDHLPQYQYDETGALCEWAMKEYSENNKHRHISHLYCAWPLYETQVDETLKAAALQAVENRQVENTASHGWVHKALVYARLNEGDRLYDVLHTMFDSKLFYDSLMTDHNTNRGSNAYCTDSSFGLIGIIDEMLLYSNSGVINALPALPSKMTKGSITGLVARTQAEVSITWNNGKAIVTILSHKAQSITISCNSKNTMVVNFLEGQTQTFEFDY